MFVVSSECTSMATDHEDADFDVDEADGDPPFATQQGAWPDEPPPEGVEACYSLPSRDSFLQRNMIINKKKHLAQIDGDKFLSDGRNLDTITGLAEELK